MYLPWQIWQTVRQRMVPKMPPDKIGISDLFNCFQLYSITDQETKLEFTELISALDDHWRKLVLEKIDSKDEDLVNGNSKSSD